MIAELLENSPSLGATVLDAGRFLAEIIAEVEQFRLEVHTHDISGGERRLGRTPRMKAIVVDP